MINNINVITQKEELYDKCENMEELYDKYYLPLLEKYYKKTYTLEQALDEIEKYVIENSQYWDETGLRYWKDEKDEPHDILEIIQKVKGDVKNENYRFISKNCK